MDLDATYFDGHSARAHPVRIRVVAGQLQIEGQGIALSVPQRSVEWPERTRHGMRVAHLDGGGLVQSEDSAAWDTWAQAQGLDESIVVKMQQNWRWVAGSVTVLLALVVGLQQWGLPLVAQAAVAATPYSVDLAIGESTLNAVDTITAPAQLPLADQQRIRDAFTQAVARQPAGSVPPWTLQFRHGEHIGANALALPGGTILLTDEMVNLVDGDAAVLTAVLAHEMGHLQHRHGMRMVVQAGVLGSLGALVWGDFSSLLAAVPVLMGQAAYSRQAEHEADVEAVRFLKAANMSPALMVTLFDKLEAERRPDKTSQKEADQVNASGSWLGIAFSSHPSDAERIAFFRAAALK
jgi:Zn-dependent protease with chaperone function